MAHALVLGGTRGLGREAVKLFSAAGYKVSVIGRREPPATDRAIPGVKHWIAELGPDANTGATLDTIVK
jgi:NAD(P)-dependent dehydrogenase (short-subunit alcohol dehydrogenase family)